MRYIPILARLRRRPAPLPIHTTYVAVHGGLGLTLDLNEALARLEMREVLKAARVRGRL